MFYLILGAVIWVIIAFWPAMIARRKGYSFILFFLLSLVFFPLSLILAFVAKDKTKTPQDIADEKAVDKELEREEKNPQKS
jgi:hypothetical protein